MAAAQNRVDADGRPQLLGKRRALTLRPGARVTVLAKQDVADALVARVPRLPSRRVDDLGHGGVLEHDACKLAPRPAEVVGTPGDALARRSGDVAVVEDVVGRVAVVETAVC